MRTFVVLIPILLSGVFISDIKARRIRIQEPDEDEQETISYYAAEPQEERGQVVLVSSADRYNGLYGQQAASSRSIDNNYIPRGSSTRANEGRTKEAKTPPVQTIRNYNKVNDDGSFTFGYEAADGSFKEETRGTDCVVRGKYGYVDPDGNKREFTYVSGNPCDPNAPKDQEEEIDNESENENIPANYPTRPIQQIRRPAVEPAPKPAVTLFQNNYAQEEEEPEPEQLLRVTPQPQPVRRPTYISRPQYVSQSTPSEEIRANYRQQVLASTTPSSVIYRTSIHPVSITPRPMTTTPHSPLPRHQLPATTFRPQLTQVSVTPRPNSLLYTKQLQSTLQPTSSPEKNDFESEFHRFQQENNIVLPTTTPFTVKSTTTKPKAAANPNQIYSTALVYDPSTGQYNNQIYQALPQSDGDYLLKQRIQPYVQRPRPQVLNIQQLQQQSPLYSQTPVPQAAYQAQQSELQFQNSAQLFAQQQQAREQQRQHQQVRTQPQQVYYIQPEQGGLRSSQIDAFLRGHNIQF